MIFLCLYSRDALWLSSVGAIAISVFSVGSRKRRAVNYTVRPPNLLSGLISILDSSAASPATNQLQLPLLSPHHARLAPFHAPPRGRLQASCCPRSRESLRFSKSRLDLHLFEHRLVRRIRESVVGPHLHLRRRHSPPLPLPPLPSPPSPCLHSPASPSQTPFQRSLTQACALWNKWNAPSMVVSFPLRLW